VAIFKAFFLGIFNFFYNLWNSIDMANIIISFMSQIVWIIFVSKQEVIARKDRAWFVDVANIPVFESQASLLQLYTRLVSLNLILTFFKIIKYVGAVSSRVNVQLKVIERSASDIYYFFVMYGIIFISFVTSFYFHYGK
jgi:hypothetical protein